MKKKYLILCLVTALAVPQGIFFTNKPVYAATTGSSGTKFNIISAAKCVVMEPNYDESKSKSLTPGTTFTKDPYIKSESDADSYCFVRVEIPTTTYTTSDGTTVIGDAVKMLYNGKEGINASDWKTVKEDPRRIHGCCNANAMG